MELKRKNSEVSQLYSDLRESFEALSELNVKLRATNEELRYRNKVQAEFINIAAHELRTPTQTIIGYCEMINIFPEKKDEYINPIKRNSERLYKLTQDILEVSRIESNSLKLDIEKIELNEVINETVIDFIRRPLYSINN